MVGKSLGHYEILDSLGAGGMGEVFLAHDVNLRREVALKLLPEELAEDAAHLARLEREALLLASINHPNIATIHSLEAVDGVRFLVLELVRGESLDRKLMRGGLPLDEALDVGRQIAEALDAAHGAGIVHRDLKPANVMVTEDGRVKVLDFGIAKDVRGLDPGSETSGPTDLTAAGAIVGTAPYMSPEQIRGQPVDKRTDIWSFGCLLYEALAGSRAFAGDTIADTLSEVLRQEPDWSALPENVPLSVRSLLERTVTKDPRRRLRDIGDAWIELERADPAADASRSETAATPGARAPHTPISRRLAGLVAAAAAGAIVVAVLAGTLEPERPTDVRRFALVGERGHPMRWGMFHSDLAISPDGRYVVYQIEDEDGEHSLYRRGLDQLEGAQLVTGRRSHNPFFSPDGLWVAFEDPEAGAAMLRRVPILGGPVETIAPLPDAAFAGASWGPDGSIVFAATDGLYRVPAHGGDLEQLTTVPEGVMHLWPDLLPGGREVLFTLRSGAAPDESDIHMLDLETGEHRPVIAAGTRPRYVAATGHLVYGGPSARVERASLRAVPFDPVSGTTRGEPVQLADGLLAAGRSGAALFDFSQEGTLVYATDSTEPAPRLLARLDRAGSAEPLPLSPDTYLHPRVSPDGTRIVYQTMDRSGRGTIWIHEFGEAAAPRRMTIDGSNTHPIWTADGDRIVYSSTREGATSVYWQRVTGGAPERLTTARPNEHHSVESWSADGVLAFSVQSGDDHDIYTLRPGDGEPQLLAGGPEIQVGAAFSPSGRWVAFGSTSDRLWRVLAVRYPPTQEVYEVSRQGLYPLWTAADEIIFRQPNNDDDLLVARVDTSAGLHVLSESALTVAPTVLTGFYRDFDPLPGGRDLIGVVPAGGTAAFSPRLVVVTGWFEELRRRAGEP